MMIGAPIVRIMPHMLFTDNFFNTMTPMMAAMTEEPPFT